MQAGDGTNKEIQGGICCGIHLAYGGELLYLRIFS